jgi:ribosomal protein S6--L-glutamate ligase
MNPPKAIETCVDKYLATSRLRAAGLPIPRTLVCETQEEALAAFELLGRDVVVKPLFGSEGRGILRLENKALAERVILTLTRLREVIYLQEFVRHPGYDVRALVLGDKVLAAMRRTAANDFRTNVACGGRFEPWTLPKDWQEIAVRAAKSVCAVFAGVDLLPSENGDPLVLEVNSTPGFQAIAQTTEVDIPAAVIEYLTTQWSARE